MGWAREAAPFRGRIVGAALAIMSVAAIVFADIEKATVALATTVEPLSCTSSGYPVLVNGSYDANHPTSERRSYWLHEE